MPPTQPSPFGFEVVAERLTVERMGPYLDSAGGDLAAALRLYDWNSAVAGAMHADLGRLEVIFRNAIDGALNGLAAANGWTHPWYDQELLFRPHQRESIHTAVERASGRGTKSPSHGAVIAELSFGFWRFLCVPAYLTSLWVPTLVSTFPRHPAQGDPRRVRADVERRMKGLHLLRNRIAHHEPIFRRDLARDRAHLLELIGWICADSQAWAAAASRTPETIAERPAVSR